MSEKYDKYSNRCIGRSAISLPAVFASSNVSTGYFKPAQFKRQDSSFDTIVSSKNFTEDEFLKSVLAREVELKSNTVFSADILRMTQKIDGHAILFRLQEIKETYKDELYFMRGKKIVIVKLRSYESKYTEAEERLKIFMSQFNLVDGEKVHGFCLGDLSIQGEFVEESGDYLWEDGAGNTFDIKIDSFVSDDSTPLLKRMKGSDSLLSIFNIGHTILRSRERTVAGMRAQEWLGWTKLGENGGEKTFKFVLETMRPKGAKEKPSLQITFDSANKLADGTQTKTNMTDEEAMAVWDRVINSIQAAR